MTQIVMKKIERGVINLVLAGVWWLLEMLAIYFSQYCSRATF